MIENVSAENDSSILSASLQHSLAPSIPRPIFYDNYYVGECPDLVFGRKLVDHAMAKGNEDNVPKILRVCIEEVNRRGLEAAGIYRVSSPAGRNVRDFVQCHCIGSWPGCKGKRGQLTCAPMFSNQLTWMYAFSCREDSSEAKGPFRSTANEMTSIRSHPY